LVVSGRINNESDIGLGGRRFSGCSATEYRLITCIGIQQVLTFTRYTWSQCATALAAAEAGTYMRPWFCFPLLTFPHTWACM